MSLVKSRSLLSTFEDEQPHLLGLGGEYPDQWVDAPAVVMAAWRRSEQQKVEVEPDMVETHPPFRSKNNETQTTKNVLLDLHRYTHTHTHICFFVKTGSFFIDFFKKKQLMKTRKKSCFIKKKFCLFSWMKKEIQNDHGKKKKLQKQNSNNFLR